MVLDPPLQDHAKLRQKLIAFENRYEASTTDIFFGYKTGGVSVLVHRSGRYILAVPAGTVRN